MVKIVSCYSTVSVGSHRRRRTFKMGNTFFLIPRLTRYTFSEQWVVMSPADMDSQPHRTCGSPSLREFALTNGISIGTAVCAGFTGLPNRDRQTHTRTTRHSVCINRPHLMLRVAMWPSNNKLLQ